MIRHSAFEGKRPLLKGALHCHTTRSDGVGSPEEVIRLHAENGYQFMALTDHRIYNYTHFAPEIPMTILPGIEVDANYPEKGVHCYHVVALGPAKEDGNGLEQDQRFQSGVVHSQEEMQPVLDMLHDNGNITIYCHPEWSNTPAREFENLIGNFAMEIWNSGGVMDNDMDTNAAYWDELLVNGKRLYGVATDDGHAMNQHCKGWVMVNADNDINSILAGLQAGAFYSSCGPEIYDFYIDNGVAHIECSPCRAVWFRYGRYPNQQVLGGEAGLTSATFEVPSYFEYLRVILMDEQGRRAWTNPIFL